MGLDDILRRQTIAFPTPRTLEKTEELLKYVARELHATMSYQVSCHKEVYSEERLVARRVTVKLSGTIIRIINFKLAQQDALSEWSRAFDSFECMNDQDSTRFAALKFSSVPGWDMEEYRPEVRKLWDDTREVLGRYFMSQRRSQR